MMISVVIPAYNCARFLSGALESVLGQTEPAGEIIVVDDGSTDNTKEVAASFAGRIKYIYQENAGPAAARNRGVQEAGGEWVAFLDGDDAWLPWRISAALKLIAGNPKAALFCGRWVDISKAQPGQPCDSDLGKTRRVPLEEFVESNPVGTSTVIMRRDIFLRLGGFDTGIKGPEDYDLWMRVAKDNIIIYADIPLARYRSVPGSLSMNDLSFLPQGLKVLNKAFGQEGALRAYLDRKDTAFAKLYVDVSWMAFERGSRRAALRYLMTAYSLDKRRYLIKGKGFKLLLRYLFGRK